jgi:tetratricopeptide (TPR) repeat protein
LLVPVVRADGEDTSWTGQRIILRTDGVRIGHADGQGQPVYIADLTDMVYRVLGERDGWLRVRQRTAEGWFPKDSAMLLEDAIPYFTNRLHMNSRDAVAYAHRARALQEKGDLERALQDYNDAIRVGSEVDEQAIPLPRLRRFLGQRTMNYPPQASWYRGRGLIYNRQDQPDKAVRDFTEAVRVSPNDPLTYVDRANVYRRLRDYDMALVDLGQAIRLDPSWGSPYFHRANLYKARKDHDRALADYSATIRLDPADADAYFNRGNTYLATRQYARAAADWSEVTHLDDEDADAHERLAWLLATCPDDKVRDGTRAVEHAGRACELTKEKSPAALATLAAAFAETGRFDLAVKWQTRALESPDYERDEGPVARRRLEQFRNQQAYRED